MLGNRASDAAFRAALRVLTGMLVVRGLSHV